MILADDDDSGIGDNSEPGPPSVNGNACKAIGNAGARIACGEIRLAVGPPSSNALTSRGMTCLVSQT